MKTLYLHVGHGKTGSSFIQSCLANSRSALLRNHGIYYPGSSDVDGAARGEISSGNGYIYATEPEQLANLELPIAQIDGGGRSCSSILISSEFLFDKLDDKLFLNAIENCCHRLEITNVEVLLFIRNPIDHVASLYQQTIKRRGGLLSINSTPFTMYDAPKRVADILVRQEHQLANMNITIKNYSYINSSLIHELCKWLNIPQSSLLLPEANNINRSLTYGELEYQRYVNEILGASSELVSDLLCYRLPDVIPDKLFPPRAIQESIIRRLQLDLDLVNSNIPLDENYKYSVVENVGMPDEIKLSRDQIKILAQGQASEILSLRGQKYDLGKAIAEIEENMKKLERKFDRLKINMDNILNTKWWKLRVKLVKLMRR